MEIAQVRAFVAVSRERNIGRAARSLRLTPSPVSRTILALERELGFDLFVRRYHDLDLTERGAQLLPLAVSLLETVAAFTSPGNSPRALRLGATPWTSSVFIDRLVSTARDETHAEPVTSAAVSADLLHSLRHGELDAALVHLPVEFAGISVRPLAGYRFRVFASSDHPLIGTSELQLADLVGRPLLMLPHSMQPAAMTSLEAQLRAAGVEDVQVLGLDEWMTFSSRLHQSDALTLGQLSPETPFARMVSLTGLISIPLAPGALDFRLGIAWRTDGSPALHRVVEKVPPLEGQPLEIVD